MKQWVFNASPLILLGKIDRLNLIECLNPSFCIPYEVMEEVIQGSADDPAANWVKTTGAVAHTLPKSNPHPDVKMWDLGSGETSVLTACLEKRGNRVSVLDDLATRKCAVVYQIDLIGTVGLLLKAKHAGLIPSLKNELDQLVRHGSQLSDSLINHALVLANES